MLTVCCTAKRVKNVPGVVAPRLAGGHGDGGADSGAAAELPVSNGNGKTLPTPEGSQPGVPPAYKQWWETIVGVSVQSDPSVKPGSLAPALNKVVTLLWPRINTYVERLILEEVEPKINQSVPAPASVKFNKVSLGESSPCFGPILVEDDPETGNIEVMLGIRFESDLDVQLTAVGIPVGISKLYLDGMIAVNMAPPKQQPPFFGGLQVFFPNPPDIQLHFDGALRAVQLPGFRGIVQSAILGAVSDVCVLPRRIALDMDTEDHVDLVDLAFPEPLGVLRLTLHSGNNLIAGDTPLIGSPTSDPYVTAVLGITEWKSEYIQKTLKPVWNEGAGVSADFYVHDLRQSLMIKVFDYDFGKADDLIGIADPLSAGELARSKDVLPREICLKEGNGEAHAGTLSVTTEFLTLSEDASRACKGGPSAAHLSFKIEAATKCSCGAAYPFKVHLRVIEEEAAQEPSAAPAKRTSVLDKITSSLSLGRRQPSENVLLELWSKPSHAKKLQQLAEALQRICGALADRGQSAEEIAAILEVDRQQVEDFLRTRGDEAAVAKLAKDWNEQCSATNPVFDMVLQGLLPSVDPKHMLEISLVNCHSETVGKSLLKMTEVLEAPGLTVHGPFVLCSGVELSGKLLLRWLC
eukprot:TRINITY_DN41895_c0_g1_i1.p1 TRINITY_DN41895_c0_g1~~TRINITY_DN41895_c0_g1_i1.p1  ORF type:complete len:662 (-),score=102.13 TRINITY_DN41895_c0_g1_i1:107-2014(-)